MLQKEMKGGKGDVFIFNFKTQKQTSFAKENTLTHISFLLYSLF
jgi:hypothetical protein